MNTVWVLCRVNDDDHATDLISVHPTRDIARLAERFYRQMNGLHSGEQTHVFEVAFEA